MHLSSLARTLRTVRHLRPSQLYWRARYRLEQRRPAAAVDAPAGLEPSSDFPRLPDLSHGDTPDESRLLQQLERGEFWHLNESRRLGLQQPDWHLGRMERSRLWTITLHYHAWAWQLAELVRRGGETGERASLLLHHYLADWITRCDLAAPGSRQLAWNAYAIATRIGYWCRLYHLLGDRLREDWGPLEPALLNSLWRQAAYLHEHLELDLRANHLLRDAVGLAYAGRFFHGPEPELWLQTATRLAVEQADEQVLADGGHFERSPMYHLHVMEDFLTLALLLEDQSARTKLRETWRRMAEFLAWVRHPDGQIPLLNDGGLNGACHPAAMLQAAEQLLGEPLSAASRQGGKFFAQFGLAVWHGQPWSVFFDLGPVGPDYQPGHAHADTLAFEASYCGRRLFVDPGTFGYDNDERRRYDRATSSHNTVSVDETDSSEVWHIFRVGRRARQLGVGVSFSTDCFEASGSHTGFDHLPGRPRHRRKIEAANSGPMRLIDRLEGRGRHALSGGLPVHPEWHIAETPNGWRLSCGDHCLRVVLEADGVDRMIQRVEYHPEYGLVQPAERLCWRGVLQLPCEIVLRVEPQTPHNQRS